MRNWYRLQVYVELNDVDLQNPEKLTQAQADPDGKSSIFVSGCGSNYISHRHVSFSYGTTERWFQPTQHDIMQAPCTIFNFILLAFSTSHLSCHLPMIFHLLNFQGEKINMTTKAVSLSCQTACWQYQQSKHIVNHHLASVHRCPDRVCPLTPAFIYQLEHAQAPITRSCQYTNTLKHQ